MTGEREQHFVPGPRLAAKITELALLIMAGLTFASPMLPRSDTGVSARQYYVSHAGRDSNAGTLSAPFATFEKADSVLQPGDTVHVDDGTWDAYTENHTITLSRSGTPQARVRWVSTNPWGAHIVGHRNRYGLGYAVQITGNYVDFEGFDVTGDANMGIWVKGVHVRIIGNHVHDIPGPQRPVKDLPCSGYGAGGIEQGNYSGGYMEVIGNVVHDVGVGGVGSCNKYQGIYLAAPHDCAFNNVVYRVSASGIHTWHAATNNAIVNNTVFGNNVGIFIGAGDNPCFGNCVADQMVVASNILYRNRTYGLLQYKRAGPHNTYTDNLAFANGMGAVLLSGACSNGDRECNSFERPIYADPQFVNPTGDFFTGDYRFVSTSPALHNGTTIGARVEEHEGRLRPELLRRTCAE